MLHVALCVMYDLVVRDRWKHATGEYATKMMHEPFFSNSASVHNQTCNHMSPMSMHNLKSKCTSPTIMHGDHTT